MVGQGKRSSQLAHLRAPCDLAALLEVSVAVLARLVVNMPLSAVRSSRPKEDGSRRQIIKAGPELESVHDLIKRRILRELRFPDCVHGYCRGRSYVSAALSHVGQPWLLSMDILSFFPSIRPEKVRAAWRRLGCSGCVATTLTRLTTLDWCLPQGFRTSNYIANMVRAPLDRRLQRVADAHGLVYTNYSDNLFLSGETIGHGIESACREAARRCGWRLHGAVLSGPGQPKIVLNMELREVLCVPQQYCDETARTIARLKTRRRPHVGPLATIRGRLSHIRQVNPAQAKPLAQMLDEVMASVGLP
jgi:RNA-directed DNA polymerase